MTISSERRQHTRYPAHHLDVLAKSQNSAEGGWAMAELISVDFNQHGIAVKSTHYFSMGERLSLVICTDDGTTTKAVGVICNRSHVQSGYRYGLHFDYQENDNEAGLRASMHEVEQALKV